MATYWLSVILAFCAFFNQISAKDANLCDEYSHPKLDCKYGLQCQSNWEWATGNYDGMVVVNKRMATLDAVSLVVKMFGDADNLTSEHTNMTTKAPRIPRGMTTITVPVTTTVAESTTLVNPVPQCCRPTHECWELLRRVELKGMADSGRLLIDDLEDWKRTECCYRDFLTPKAFCINPIGRNRGWTWYEPPLCSLFHS